MRTSAPPRPASRAVPSVSASSERPARSSPVIAPLARRCDSSGATLRIQARSASACAADAASTSREAASGYQTKAHSNSTATTAVPTSMTPRSRAV